MSHQTKRLISTSSIILFLKFSISLLLLMLITNSYAESDVKNEILTIDEPVPDTLNLEFSDGNTLEAKTGEFKIKSLVLMSNLAGERWATVTIKNVSSYQRILDKEHIIALFANGERRNPVHAEHKFSGQEETTMIITFGESKFPVLKVMVRN